MGIQWTPSKVIILYRTDTTLDLSQKAEKGMNYHARTGTMHMGPVGRLQLVMVGRVGGVTADSEQVKLGSTLLVNYKFTN